MQRLFPKGVQLHLLGDKSEIAGICSQKSIDSGSFVIVHCCGHMTFMSLQSEDVRFNYGGDLVKKFETSLLRN